MQWSPQIKYNKTLSLQQTILGKREIFLMMDGVAWYKLKDLMAPDNINTIIQPPYSPEVNPVERLCQYSKHNILRNKIYKNLLALENEVCRFLINIDVKTIRRVGDGYLYH